MLGVLLILASTLLMRILSVVMAEIAYDTASLSYRILFAVIYVLDDIIFACGAGTVAYFIIRGNRKYAYLSMFYALLILALDFAASYLIAYLLDYTDSTTFVLMNGALLGDSDVPGTVALLSNILILILNLALRALTYMMIIYLSRFFLKNASAPDEVAHIFSRSHPVCRMAAVSAVFRIVPYLVYEIYSTVYFLIRNITKMSFDNVVNILLAYGQIVVDGVITYFAVYIVMTAVSLVKKER